jgi:hypothetical protein
MPVTFPYNAKFQSVRFQLVGRSAAGGVGLSGATTRVASSAAHWIAEAKFLIDGHEGFLAWEGFISAMQGVLGETNVPAWSRILPFDQNGRALSRTGAVGVGGTSLADNTGLAQSPLTHATLKNAAALRDTIIQVEYLNTTGIRPGHKIGIGDRVYDVVYSYGDTGGETTLQIMPPLRAACSVGARIVLDIPVCRMRFETDGEGVLPFTIATRDLVAVNFREVY